MLRTARKKSKSGIYHIILREINRQKIFEDEEDAIKFLQTLEEYKEKSGYNLYVYWYNWKYSRCGHLFQDRYKSEVVEDEKYLLTVLRYIHQNPLKAEKIVNDVATYKWSRLL